MKLIDLLNKIANGEEVPKKIKYENDIYILTDNYCYYSDETNLILSDRLYAEQSRLNDEIEILDNLEEEKKIPEKLKIEQDTPISNYYIRNENGTKCGLTKHSKMIAEKLNQLIDYLKSKGDE